jgi:hypothetical protein
MMKGDATWPTRKVVLTCLDDTLIMTVQLPAHRFLCFFEILDSVTPSQRRTTITKWQKILGGAGVNVVGHTRGGGSLALSNKF